MTSSHPRIPPVIQVYSGEFVNLLDPKTDTIHITDIARALSRICRFTKHCEKFYSVAQHSVLVSKTVPEHLALEGLLHDASKTYLGDVATPLKQLLPEYLDLEARMNACIARTFGLMDLTLDEIKKTNKRVLATECRDLLPMTPHVWWDSSLTLPELIRPLPPPEAEGVFLDRFYALIKREDKELDAHGN